MKKKIVGIFYVFLMLSVVTLLPTVNACVPVVDKLLGLDRKNAIYMLIRETTWEIRGDQDMDLTELLAIRTSAETSIGLMTILPGQNRLLSLRLSFAIFLLAMLFSKEDGGNFQHTIDLYQQMIVPTKEGMEKI